MTYSYYCDHHINGPIDTTVNESAPRTCPRPCCDTDKFSAHKRDCNIGKWEQSRPGRG